MLVCLHIINIGTPSRFGRWEVSGTSCDQEIAGTVSAIPDGVRKSVLKNARDLNDLATADARAAIGGFHPLGPRVNRFRPGNGLLWALFEARDVNPATIRISFADEVEKRYSIAPSPAVAKIMRDEKTLKNPLIKRLGIENPTSPPVLK